VAFCHHLAVEKGMLRFLVAPFSILLIISTGALWPTKQALAEQTPPAGPAELVARLRTLHLLSAGLIEQASTGLAPANDFQLQARIYREQLRQTMLANEDLAAPQRLPQDLLLGMVRMSALLHAAADCKSGLVIICPPDLLRQLRAQHASVGETLQPFDVMGGGPS
jgi:hypothetical protein